MKYFFLKTYAHFNMLKSQNPCIHVLKTFNYLCFLSIQELNYMYLFHNHTNFCDGKNSLEEMLEAVVKKNISVFGFSSHSPLPFENPWSIKDIEEAEKYVDMIKLLKHSGKNENIRILKGLEADYIPGITSGFDTFRKSLNLDYIIGSVHLVKTSAGIWFIDGAQSGYDDGIEKYFDNDIRKAVSAYYQQMLEMIGNEKFEILAHMDKVTMNNAGRFFKAEDEWHLQWVEKVISEAVSRNIIIEINTRGIYTGKHPDFYPGEYMFHLLRKYQAKVIISTDAHRVEELCLAYSNAELALLNAGINHLHYPLDGEIKVASI